MNDRRNYQQTQSQDRPAARRWPWAGVLVGTLGLALVPTAALAAGDPTGGDPGSQDALRAANFSWVLVAAFLVFFMQAGFAFLGAGFHSCQEHGQLPDQEFPRFLHGLALLLGIRLCADVGWLQGGLRSRRR